LIDNRFVYGIRSSNNETRLNGLSVIDMQGVLYEQRKPKILPILKTIGGANSIINFCPRAERLVFAENLNKIDIIPILNRNCNPFLGMQDKN